MTVLCLHLQFSLLSPLEYRWESNYSQGYILQDSTRRQRLCLFLALVNLSFLNLALGPANSTIIDILSGHGGKVSKHILPTWHCIQHGLGAVAQG